MTFSLHLIDSKRAQIWALQACCLTAAERRHEQTVLEVEQLLLHQVPAEEERKESSAQVGSGVEGRPDSTPVPLQATKVGQLCSSICSFAHCVNNRLPQRSG